MMSYKYVSDNTMARGRCNKGLKDNLGFRFINSSLINYPDKGQHRISNLNVISQ